MRLNRLVAARSRLAELNSMLAVTSVNREVKIQFLLFQRSVFRFSVRNGAARGPLSKETPEPGSCRGAGLQQPAGHQQLAPINTFSISAATAKS